jgi:hypothetical protein
MELQYAPNLPLARFARVACIAIVSVLAIGSAFGAALDPEKVQVQYLPRDGAAIVFWNSVENATGYNLYEQEVTQPGTPTQATARMKVNTDPIKTTSQMVDNLKNGTPYHFTVTAIVGGQETDPVGPRVAVHSGDDLGQFVAVVPQTPVKLAGIDGFFGLNVGTDFPGSHTVDANGTITMKASGWDIQDNADGMYFLAVPMQGDITVTVRMVSGPTATANESTWNLGGPQIRASLDAGSVLAMTQAASAGRAQFKYRDAYDSGPQEEDEDDSQAGHNGDRRPIWLRLVRKGNNFSGFLSDDGKTFTLLDGGNGGVHSIADFPKEAYVGLALASHDDGEYTTAVFDNLTITSP